VENDAKQILTNYAVDAWIQLSQDRTERHDNGDEYFGFYKRARNFFRRNLAGVNPINKVVLSSA
jgi:hypothetical protein